ncbi:MAG: EcsC family protein [bacterium]
MLTPYETTIYRDITHWENQGPTMFTRVGRLASAPAEWIAGTLLPPKIRDMAGETLARLLTHTNDAIHRTTDIGPIFIRAQKHGHRIIEPGHLRTYHMPLSDDLAQFFARRHVNTTMITGGLAGLGGFALAAIDIPMLFSVNLRMIQHVAVSYGYDLSDPVERHFALQLFQAAAGDPKTKIGLLQELVLVRRALQEATLAEMAGSSAVATGLVGLRKMAAQVGIELTEKKMLAMVPIIGAGIGAGFNYLFTKQVATAATMGYRKRFLQEKYPGLITIEGEVVE